ncbi:CaiB/BaiF CoA transferase family protein [Microbulbifer sp. JMSA004]|uniref:CaiB/BaiF CoA transferase family protein n=1 Tax=unclassified Microbulbifer TaxID=2619833 RepID=UPI0024AE253E|nr:CoA transferase [Microbulbifer sp. VAAF005]WHI47247.1 CoA transferase [Microbulbifer sp. VAAF005]
MMLPLHGKRILSFETWGAGSFHGTLLAFLGAEVVNIEDPKQDGNPLRKMGSIYLDEAREDNETSESTLHNKKSLALDIRAPAGRKVFLKLVNNSHAVIDNFRGSLPEELGVTYADLKVANPKIVCTHLSGYGRDNNRKHWPGYDFLMQAETGWMSVTGEPGSIPTKVGVSVVDLLGSVYSALCTVSGLLRTEVTGKGGDFDTNLFDIALNCLCYQGLWFLNEGIVPGKQPRSAHASQAPCQLVKTSDGWLYIACLTEKFWELLCDELGSTELQSDIRFLSNDNRMKHRELLTHTLDQHFTKKNTEDWCAQMEGKIPCAPVYDIAQALNNTYVRNNGKVTSIPYTRSEKRKSVQYISAPFSIPDSPAMEFQQAPLYGENTLEILNGLGIPKDEIDQLSQAGTIYYR